MIIKDITIENFHRYEKSSICLQDFPGITIIEGGNGSGKSTLIECIEWILYGVSQRYGKSCDDIVGPFKKWAKAEVTLFDASCDQVISIVRYRKHPDHGNGVFISVNGNQITDADSVNTHVQTKIDALLGMDHASFKSACIAHQNSFSSFAAATDKEKKAIMQKMLGLSQIPKALEYVKEKVLDLKDQDLELKRKVSNVENSIETHQSNLAILSNSHKDSEVTLKQSISQTSADISEYREKLEDSEDNIENFDREIEETTCKIKELDKEISEAKEKVTQEWEVLEEEVEKCAEEYSNFDADIPDELLKDWTAKKAKIREIKQSGQEVLRKYEDTLSGLKRELKELTSSSSSKDTDIALALRNHELLTTQVEECDKAKADLLNSVGVPCDKCGVPMTKSGIKSAEQSISDSKEKLLKKCIEEVNSVEALKEELEELAEQIRNKEKEISDHEKSKPEVDLEQARKDAEDAASKIELAKNKVELERQKLQGALDKQTALLEKAKSQFEISINRVTTQQQEEKSTLDKLTALRDQENQNKESLRKHVDKSVSRLKELKTERKKLKEKQESEKKSILEDIEILGTELSELSKESEKISHELKHYTWWVDGFGDKGLKSHILETYVPELNRVVKKFNHIMTAGQCDITFSATTNLKSGKISEKFDVQVKNKKGAHKFKGNSGGEQMRINLAIFMTLQIVGLKGKFQQMFLDECVKDLDGPGVEKYFQLLKYMRDTEGISSFIITHDQNVKGLCDNQINVVKQETKEGMAYSSLS